MNTFSHSTIQHIILEKAIQLAVLWHKGQFDRSGKPYILHPLRVMSYIKTDDEELLAVAVLHDVVEDNFADDFERGFTVLAAAGMTERIITALRLLSHKKGIPYAKYIETLASNPDARTVKKADLRHNMDLRRLKGVTEKDMERVNKYIKAYHYLDNYKDN